MRLAFFITLFLIVTFQASAQEHHSLGIFGGYSINIHTANFQKLPGVPNCCPRFEEGSGAGPYFGLLYQMPLSDLFALQLRAGYQSLNGELTTTEGTTVLHAGEATPGEFTHYLDAELAAFGIEPMLGFSLLPGMQVHLGVGAGAVLTKSFEQREEISKPDGAGTFLDSLGIDTRKRVRNQFAGEIPNAASLRLALLGGLSYALPLNTDRTLFIAPEVFYTFGLTPVASDLEWSVHSLRLGVSIRYSPRTDAVPVAVETPVVATTPVPAKPALTATVTASGVNASSNEFPIIRLTVEEFSSTLMTPLLNYIFFDENSAAIPARYQQLQPQSVSSFDIDRINSPQKLPTYHQLLNIIGRRMRDNPSATITLIGNNQDIRDEKGNTQLSRQRAEGVRDYLKNVWGIADSRMKIEARNLPAKAANTETQDGAEENRRVEIISSDARILAPIITNDTLRRSDPSTVRFRAEANSEAGVATWQLRVVQDGRMLKQFEGSGRVPSTIDWNIADEWEAMPKYQGDIRYTLTLRDVKGTEARTEQTIPVEQLTIHRKRTERRGDTEIDRFSLILFDVRSSEISPAGASIIPVIRERIRPTSTVTITGYTDRLGDAAYNQQLAENRAAAVARALGIGTANGIGQADLYDSSLPEGRLYTRTVDVVIETPVGE